MNHIQSQIKNPALATNNTLHVIGVVQNPVRYHSRYRLFRQWLKEMLATPNVKVHVVEAVYGDRQAECDPKTCDMGDFSYHSVKITSEIWLKENLINIAEENLLPKDWQTMCWSDCDIHFADSSWALNTIHQLQHYNIVQPWQSASDLDFYGNVMDTWTSFGSLCAKGKPMYHDKTSQYTYAHTGYAWACTRYFYENVVRLADFNIVGAGDHLMAWACLDMVARTMPQTISQDYKDTCQRWADKASRACAKMVGFTPGRLEHSWHGAKVNRKYWSRWDIPVKNDFQPSRDLAYDSQGVLVLCGKNKYAIESAIMNYNRARNEDSIDNN